MSFSDISDFTEKVNPDHITKYTVGTILKYYPKCIMISWVKFRIKQKRTREGCVKVKKYKKEKYEKERGTAFETAGLWGRSGKGCSEVCNWSIKGKTKRKLKKECLFRNIF